jgi:hypothetical protein
MAILTKFSKVANPEESASSGQRRSVHDEKPLDSVSAKFLLLELVPEAGVLVVSQDCAPDSAN